MAAPWRCHMFFITPSPFGGLRHSFGKLKLSSSQTVLRYRTVPLQEGEF